MEINPLITINSSPRKMSILQFSDFINDKRVTIYASEEIFSFVVATRGNFQKDMDRIRNNLTVRQLIELKNWGLLTEDLELFHDEDVIVVRQNFIQWVKENIKPQEIKQIEVMLAIGIATDQSGLLQWYKQHNHAGKIVCINSTFPNYLDEEDIFVEGEPLELLKSLLERLKQIEFNSSMKKS